MVLQRVKCKCSKWVTSRGNLLFADCLSLPIHVKMPIYLCKNVDVIMTLRMKDFYSSCTYLAWKMVVERYVRMKSEHNFHLAGNRTVSPSSQTGRNYTSHVHNLNIERYIRQACLSVIIPVTSII